MKKNILLSLIQINKLCYFNNKFFLYSCEENYVCCSVIEILTGSIDNTNNNGGGGNTNINNNSNGSITGGNGGGSNIGGFNTTGSGDDGNVPSGGNVNHVNRPSTNADCICISPNQCDRDPDEASSGAGLLDIKYGN